MGLSTLYFAYVIKFDPNVSRLGELLFIGFHRILVVVGFAWATYAFSFDSGGLQAFDDYLHKQSRSHKFKS